MKGMKSWAWIMTAMTALFWLGACGGGSSSDGGGGVIPTASYAIDSTNNVDKMLGSFSDMVPGCFPFLDGIFPPDGLILSLF